MATSLGLGPEKSFTEHLQILKDMLIRGENFAFSRFSDGEIYMLQKKEIVMSPNGALVGDIKLPGNYPEDDWKHYDPEEHEFYRKKLEEAIQYKADNYYKGLSCRCCIADGEDNCRPIELSAEDLRWVAKVLKGNAPTSLPSNGDVVRGCFFGDEEWWDELCERAHEDAKVFEKAAEWLESGGDEYWHSVEYQASW